MSQPAANLHLHNAGAEFRPALAATQRYRWVADKQEALFVHPRDTAEHIQGGNDGASAVPATDGETCDPEIQCAAEISSPSAHGDRVRTLPELLEEKHRAL